MSTIQVSVVSAEETIFSGTALSITAPGIMGDLQIFPNHAPLLTMLKPGTVSLRVEGQEDLVLIFIDGGIFEVQPGAVSVLADSAIRGTDLDESKILEAKALAEEQIQNKLSDFEAAKAESELASAIEMLKTIRKIRDQQQH